MITKYGSNSADYLDGSTRDANRIYGFAGNDTLIGYNGRDTL